jgi:paraquat-inducible protein B
VTKIVDEKVKMEFEQITSYEKVIKSLHIQSKLIDKYSDLTKFVAKEAKKLIDSKQKFIVNDHDLSGRLEGNVCVVFTRIEKGSAGNVYLVGRDDKRCDHYIELGADFSKTVKPFNEKE